MKKMRQITVVAPGHETMTSNVAFADAMALLEAAGRTCYKSEPGKTPESRDKFVGGIIRRGHLSVIEHVSLTVRIICSRSCSHQLVRHRIAAYSQESQRYCDYGRGGLQVICPQSIADLNLPLGVYESGCIGPKDTIGFQDEAHEPMQELSFALGIEQGRGDPSLRRAERWLTSVINSYEAYVYFRDQGVPPEDARSLLPNATKTEVVTTFNLRQWRHVFEDRALNPKAQWEIRGIMLGILKEFAERLPVIFGDMLLPAVKFDSVPHFEKIEAPEYRPSGSPPIA
jgi:thymidylate synthase (FAD)